MKHSNTALAAALTTLALSPLYSQAASIQDPRALGMGGVGVTVATSRNASLINPAALAATHDDDNFALGLPILGARVADPDKLRDDIDDLESSGDSLTASLDAFNIAINDINATISGAGTPSNGQITTAESTSRALSSSLTEFNNNLNQVNNKNIESGAMAGVILAIPRKTFGLGLYVSANVDLGARFNYAATDSTTITGHATTATTIADALSVCASAPATCSTISNTIDATNDGDIDDMDSTLSVRGVAMGEVGISIARRFTDLGNVDIGITPKLIKIQTFNYEVSAQDTEIDKDRGQLEDDQFNADIGITKTYGDRYKAGLVVKNLLGGEFDFADSTDSYKLKPHARLGVSHHTDWSTVGVDVDLTQQQGLGNGFSQDTQFLSIGAEFDVRFIQLRLGYRHDLAGNYDGMPSLGLGLNLFGVHADFAVAAAGDKEVIASAQLGLNF